MGHSTSTVLGQVLFCRYIIIVHQQDFISRLWEKLRCCEKHYDIVNRCLAMSTVLFLIHHVLFVHCLGHREGHNSIWFWGKVVSVRTRFGIRFTWSVLSYNYNIQASGWAIWCDTAIVKNARFLLHLFYGGSCRYGWRRKSGREFGLFETAEHANPVRFESPCSTGALP